MNRPIAHRVVILLAVLAAQACGVVGVPAAPPAEATLARATPEQAAWQPLCEGTSIGRKKIDRFVPTEVTKLRWRCLKSVAEPRVRRLAAYAVGGEAVNIPAEVK
jgi:hypothetical protein